MLPLQKLAAQILGLGIAFGLSLFLTFLIWGPFAFLSASLWFVLADRVLAFKFVYENTKESDESSNP